MNPLPDANLEAEQAVLAALMVDADAWADVADVLRPEIFAYPHHEAIAAEVQALAREQKPVDQVLVAQRLHAAKAGVPGEYVLELGRAIGSASNIRHYALLLDSLWAKREAKRIAAELVRSDLDVSGEEFVGRFAERLSAIETKHARPAQKLVHVAFSRLERREAIQKNPALLRAWPTGFNQLDAVTGGFRPGHLFTIAARQGVGKTAVMSSILRTLGEKNVPTGVFMLEDYADALGDRTLMREGKIPSPLLRDSVHWGSDTWNRASEAVERVKDWPIFIDDRHQQTIHEITGSMRRMVRDHGVRVFFLDNLAEVVVDRQDRSDERHDQALGRIAKLYRDAAKALDAAPVLVVHLSRGADKRNDGRPQIFDIKNSGEIEEASHVIALMARERDSTALKVYVDKNRNGPPSEFELFYNKDLMEVRNEEAA